MDLEIELLGNYSVEEIKRGFIEDTNRYTCLMCGERFEKGEIFAVHGHLYEAYKTLLLHIQQQHGSMQDYLLKTRAQHLGISDLQLQLLNFFASGMSDKEIAEKLGVSSSTIRNHRYKLRERERQNRMFLALMESLDDNSLKGRQQCEEKETVYAISDKEKKRVLEHYMTEEGKLKAYPSLERNKRIILEEAVKHFLPDRQYTEDEVKSILETVGEDYKFLRDEMLTYDYLERAHKGDIYWAKLHNL